MYWTQQKKTRKIYPGKYNLIKPSHNAIPDDVDYAFLGAWNF